MYRPDAETPADSRRWAVRHDAAEIKIALDRLIALCYGSACDVGDEMGRYLEDAPSIFAAAENVLEGDR